jgi:Ethylbenzene dehydrogenase/Prokaryotic cytochrome b561
VCAGVVETCVSGRFFIAAAGEVGALSRLAVPDCFLNSIGTCQLARRAALHHSPGVSDQGGPAEKEIPLMADGRRPTTDSGTVVMHAIFVVSFLVLVFTGLRIATDDPATLWLAVLDPILPVEQLWRRHMIAALIFTSTLIGYVVYLLRARLTARVRFDTARAIALSRPGKARWAACNAAIFWALMACLITEIVTGTMLFFGTGGLASIVHLWATWGAITLVCLHIACHVAIGGVRQLARIFRPAPLIVAPPPPDLAELLAEQLNKRDASAPPTELPKRSASAQKTSSRGALYTHPAATAAAVAVSVSVFGVGMETVTRPVLRIVEITAAEAPSLDGDLSDPAWAKTVPISVMTTQGGDFGGSGQSQVEIRAVHDGVYAYFAFVWADPTRSLKHHPLIKAPTGWQTMATDQDAERDGRLSDDKFSVLLTRPAFPLIGAAIHLAAAPQSDRPASSTGRGLHYTDDGSIADVWIWRASHGGMIGHIDNGHFGGIAQPTPEQLGGHVRYTGGFALDPGPPAYRSNVSTRPTANTVAEIMPSRLPRDLDGTSRALGRVSNSVAQSESEGARWWMTDAESMPYSKAADDKIPPGTVIPGIVMHDAIASTSVSIRGVARWAAGRWTLEVARRLYTGGTYDLPIKTGSLMWVAAFDHSETRHTRHLRPLRLEVE